MRKMTNEEAMKMLGNLKLYHDDDNDICEAIDISIETLKQQRPYKEAEKSLYLEAGLNEYLTSRYPKSAFADQKRYYCSVCHELLEIDERPYYSFCPNCGVPMNDKLDDFFMKACDQLQAETEKRKREILINVKPNNFYKVSKEIAEIDAFLADIEKAKRDWEDGDSGGAELPGFCKDILINHNNKS